jgi:uncharacterized membrane protein YfhO
MRKARKHKGVGGIVEKKTVAENKFIQKYGLYILLSLIAIMVIIVFYDFIIFKKLFLFKGLASDSLNDTYPHYILISDYLRTEGIPGWSFRQGLGQNIYPFSFPDPFVSLLYLLGRDNLAYGIAYMEILKIFVAGVLFYYFLKKRSLSEYACVTGGLLYSFSGFIIIGSSWNLFSTEAVYFAFLLLAFEKYYQDNNRLLFPLAVALIAVLQPFDLWLFGLFLLFYIIVRHFEVNEKASRKFFVLLGRTGLMALLGVGIASFFFLSEVRAMLNSPRVSGGAGYYEQLLSKAAMVFESGLHYITAVMRLFSSELLGPANKFGGWYNYMEAPLFYCGLINLLVLPQLFRFLDKRRKQIYAVSLIVVLLPAIFPIMRYSLWLFTGNYYRLYSLFVAFALMFLGIQALHNMFKHRDVNRKLLLLTLFILFIVLYFPYNYLQDHDVLDENLRNLVMMFLVIYTVLLLFLPGARNFLRIQLVLLAVVCIELAGFSKINLDERKALTRTEYRQKTGYSDYTNEAVAFLNKIDRGFFRVTKNYHSGPGVKLSLNDAKIQQYRGTSSYHSFNQLYYVRFLAGMNIIDENDEGQTRWIIGLGNNPLLHSLVGVKYYLSKSPRPHSHVNYDSLTTVGNVNIYRNKYALPLGFSYSRYISREDFNNLSRVQKGFILYSACIPDDSVYKDHSNDLPFYNAAGAFENYSMQKYRNDISSLKTDTLAISQFSDNKIKGTITLKEKKMLFLSIPYSPGWSALVDGKKQKPLKINIGFLGLLLDKGPHTVELSFTPPMFYPGAVISAVSILLYVLLIVISKRRKGIQPVSL